MSNLESAAAMKLELYERFFQPLGRLTGEILLNPSVGESIDLAYRSGYGQALREEDDPRIAGGAGIMEVAGICGEVSVAALSRLIDRRPSLLPWLRANVGAIHLGADGLNIADDADMLAALETKAYRNTLLGFGRILLWNAGVDRYMQQTLPAEYEEGLLWPTLIKSQGAVNRLAATADEEENKLVSMVVTSTDAGMERLHTWGALAEAVHGTAYVDDPQYIQHRGEKGARVMTLTVAAAHLQEAVRAVLCYRSVSIRYGYLSPLGRT